MISILSYVSRISGLQQKGTGQVHTDRQGNGSSTRAEEDASDRREKFVVLQRNSFTALQLRRFPASRKL